MNNDYWYRARPSFRNRPPMTLPERLRMVARGLRREGRDGIVTLLLESAVAIELFTGNSDAKRAVIHNVSSGAQRETSQSKAVGSPEIP